MTDRQIENYKSKMVYCFRRYSSEFVVKSNIEILKNYTLNRNIIYPRKSNKKYVGSINTKSFKIIKSYESWFSFIVISGELEEQRLRVQMYPHIILRIASILFIASIAILSVLDYFSNGKSFLSIEELFKILIIVFLRDQIFITGIKSKAFEQMKEIREILNQEEFSDINKVLRNDM